MEITLPPHTAQRIRAALGDGVNLSSEMLPAALARLAVEAPAAYSGVLAEISGSQIRLDSERELQRRRRRGVFRRALFWWGEYESEVGDRLLAKRHVAAAVPFGLASIILILLVLSATVSRHSSSPSGYVVAVKQRPQGIHARPGTPVPHRDAVSHRVVRSRNSAVFPDPPIPALAASLPPGPMVPSPLQPMPLLPLSVKAGPPGNPVVIDLSLSPAPTGIPADVRPAGVAGISPIVYDRTAEEARTPTGTADLRTLAADPETAGPQGGDAGERSPGVGNFGVPPHPWVPGRRVSAHLVTGLVVLAGGPPVPVVAESTDPPGAWLGRAFLDPEGLVQMNFTLTSRAEPGTVHGIALNPDRLIPGLFGKTTLRHPRAASAILSAALRATADYVQALARQEQATIGYGWAQLTVGQVAPAWTYFAGSLAQGLEPRGGAAIPVETTEIAPGIPLVILVTEGS